MKFPKTWLCVLNKIFTGKFAELIHTWLLGWVHVFSYPPLIIALIIFAPYLQYTINHISIKPELKQSRQSIMSDQQYSQTPPRPPVIQNCLLFGNYFGIKHILWNIVNVKITIWSSHLYLYAAPERSPEQRQGPSDCPWNITERTPERMQGPSDCSPQWLKAA